MVISETKPFSPKRKVILMSAQSNNLQQCYQFCETITHLGRREVIQNAILLGLEVIANEPPEIRNEIDLLALVGALNDVLSTPQFLHVLSSGAGTDSLTLTSLKGMLKHSPLRSEQTGLIIAFLERVFAKPTLVRNLMGMGSSEAHANSAIDSTQSNDDWISERDLMQLAQEAAQPIPSEAVELLKAEREKCLAFIDEFKKAMAKPARNVKVNFMYRIEDAAKIILAHHPTIPTHYWKEGEHDLVLIGHNHQADSHMANLIASAIDARLRQMRMSAVAACVSFTGLSTSKVTITDDLDNGVSFEWGSADTKAVLKHSRRESN